MSRRMSLAMIMGLAILGIEPAQALRREEPRDPREPSSIPPLEPEGEPLEILLRRTDCKEEPPKVALPPRQLPPFLRDSKRRQRLRKQKPHRSRR